MQTPLRAAIFDVDGVLLDSLPQHLRICEDKAREFGLRLEIPGTAEFRHRVSAGLRISPMKAFFLAVGFPDPLADRAVADYEREFATRYRPTPFPGVDDMLDRLRHAGLRLGLVTSNTIGNVAPALGPILSRFEPEGRFYFDGKTAPQPKSWWLAECARRFGLTPEACVYVGDQPADAQAARDAGLPFIGVTYGWGIAPGDPRFDTVDSVAAIAGRLTRP